MPATTVVMPKMGYDMAEGKIVQWLKKEGDRVTKGEAIAEIETEKVNIQIEAFASGAILQLLVPEGQTVSVGQPIATIGEPGEKPAEAPPSEILPEQQAGAGEGAEAPPTTVESAAPEVAAPAAEVEATPAAEVHPDAQEAEARPAGAATPEEETDRVKVSPVARRFAQEQGVELSQVRGTGPGGRITKEDVQGFLTQAAARRQTPEKAVPPPAAADAAAPPARPATEAAEPAAKPAEAQQPPKPAPAPAPQAAAPLPEGVPAETRDLSRMGQAIARRMSESKRTVPHFYATVEIDMSHVASLRHELNRTLSGERKISFNDFVMKAAAMALSRYPLLNASYADDKVKVFQQFNVAMAIALDQGLIAPVIKECDQKPLAQIARESKELVEGARQGSLRQEQYEGATFTVSNMGPLGIDEFAAIINPPQAAILAVGTVAPRPVVRDGALAVAETMRATISADHRVANGADAARYLQELRRLLEDPVALLL